MPDAISQALAGKTIGTAGQAFDDYYAQSDVIIVRIETEAATYSDINPYKLVLYALSLGLKALAGLSAAIGFAITIFAKVALAIIIALRSEEHTSELQSLMRISYAVFCLKKKT